MNILTICPVYILPSDYLEMGKINFGECWKFTRTKVIEEDVIIFVFNAIFMIYLICIFKAFVFASNLNI